MSQRAEKYARSMEKRVINLEQAVGKVTTEQERQSVHISELEDDLAVYRAAVAERDLKEARRKLQNQRQQSRMAGKARRKKARTTAVLAALVVIEVILLALIICFISAAERDKQADTSPVSTAVYKPEAMPEYLAATTEKEKPEMPAEEMREESAQERRCFSAEIPLSFEYQDVMRTYCEAYSCPYSLALAVAEVESNFDMDAVGASGEVGIMQLNPGPGGSYHAEIQAATGMDPTTPSGNIAGGCYKLGQYMAEYQDAGKAAMAYNMGRAGAMAAWEAGITSTDYSNAVLEAMEGWACLVDAE